MMLSGRSKKCYTNLAKLDPHLDDGTEIEMSTGGSRYVKMYEITSGFVKRT